MDLEQSVITEKRIFERTDSPISFGSRMTAPDRRDVIPILKVGEPFGLGDHVGFLSLYNRETNQWAIDYTLVDEDFPVIVSPYAGLDRAKDMAYGIYEGFNLKR